MSKGIRIWVVDDDGDSRLLLCQLLARQMAVESLQEFSSAEAVLAALKIKPAPEVILMDVQLPGMNGLEAVPKVRQLTSHTRVLVITSFFDENNRGQAMANGATGFLCKKSLRKIVDAIQGAMFQPVPLMGSDMTGTGVRSRL